VEKTKEMVMFNSDQAAQFRTNLSGWVSRNGRYFGNDERAARYDGCTHTICEDCGNPVDRGYLICQECREKRDKSKYDAMPKVWNKRDKNCPKDAVYVGRPSKWGNPFKITREHSRQDVIGQYENYIIDKLACHKLDIAELRGKDLVCWCAPAPCHADVLLELANQEAK